MTPYLDLVRRTSRLREDGRGLSFGGFAPCGRVPLRSDAPRVLVFSPHPDDECIIGGLPLRLLRESQWRVLNVAVTLGSKPERQAGRLAELRGACDFLQFELLETAPHGLEGIHRRSRDAEAAGWRAGVEGIARILREQAPKVVFFPHELDWNSTHVGTHLLVLDALKSLPPAFETFVVETEFWGQMPTPNLMVESTVEQVADLMAGCSFHVGEVRRNPYHLSQTAWMQDNVRRGSELVGGQGGASPDFGYATLYRLQRWSRGDWFKTHDGGRNLSAQENPASLFS